MRRSARLLLATSLFAPASLVALASWGAPAAGEVTPAAQLATCYQRSHLMVAALLIDQTGSLRGSDPAGLRVGFAQAVVGSLASLQAAAGGTVQVSAAGFGNRYQEYLPYSSVTSDSVDGFASKLQEFSARTQDGYTDYVTGLQSAKQSVDAAAGRLSPSAPDQVCKVIVWLTDGVFDVGTQEANPQFTPEWFGQPVTASNAGQADQVGRRLLCNGGGLADQLRQDLNLYLVAVGIGTPGRSSDFSLMSAIALGQPSGGGAQWSGGCGTATAGRGAFYTGADVANLTLQLVGNLLDREPSAVTPCKPAGCSFAFSTFPHTVGATIALTSSQLDRLTLTAPDGASSILSPGRTVVPGLTTWVSAGPYPVVRLRITPGTGPSGRWVVSGTPTGPSPSLSEVVRLDPGVSLRTSGGRSSWKRGESSTATFHLRWSGGPWPTALTPTSSHLRALVDEGGSTVPAEVSEPDGQGMVVVRYTPPANDPSAVAQVQVTGKVTLPADEGGQVVHLAAQATASIGLSGFPMPQGGLNLGTIHARSAHHLDPSRGPTGQPTAITAALAVRGAPGDDGSFCIQAGSLRPRGSGPSGKVLATSCRDVPAGETVQVPVKVSLAAPWNGSLSGAKVSAVTKAGGKAEPVEIPVTGSVQVPITIGTNQGTLWLLIAGSVLAAALLWLLAAWFTSALYEPDMLRGVVTSVRLREGEAEVTPLPGGGEWSYLQPERAGRARAASFMPGNLGEPLRLRAPLRLLAVQDVLATRNGYLAHGSAGAPRFRRHAGRLAHRVQGEWVVAVPEGSTAEDGELTGELFVFVRSDAGILGESDFNAVIDLSRQQLSQLFAELQSRLPGSASPGEDGSFGGDEASAPSSGGDDPFLRI